MNTRLSLDLLWPYLAYTIDQIFDTRSVSWPAFTASKIKLRLTDGEAVWHVYCFATSVRCPISYLTRIMWPLALITAMPSLKRGGLGTFYEQWLELDLEGYDDSVMCVVMAFSTVHQGYAKESMLSNDLFKTGRIW